MVVNSRPHSASLFCFFLPKRGRRSKRKATVLTVAEPISPSSCVDWCIDQRKMHAQPATRMHKTVRKRPLLKRLFRLPMAVLLIIRVNVPTFQGKICSLGRSITRCKLGSFVEDDLECY